MKQNKNAQFHIGGSGRDQTDDFQKFCASGLDWIQFHWIMTGLGLENFSPLISAIDTPVDLKI